MKQFTILSLIIFLILLAYQPLQAQDIDVQRPLATSIPDGGTDALGNRPTGTQFTLTYTFLETSGVDLDVTGMSVSNLSNCSIGSVTATPELPETLNSSSLIVEIQVTVTNPGLFSFDMDIANTDDAIDGDTEENYDITVSGSGIPGEIDIQRPASFSISDGSTDNVGNRFSGSAFVLTYTIQESQNSNLTITSISPASAANCTVNSITASAVLPNVLNNSSMTFDVTVTPTANGAFSFELDVLSDDADETNYDILVSGTALTTIPPDEALGVSIQPLFTWAAGTGPYVLEISTADGGSFGVGVEFTSPSQGGTTFDLSTTSKVLYNNTKYYWRIVDNGVVGSISEFTTTQNVTPYLTAPVGGIQISTPTVQLYWNTYGYNNLLYDIFYSTTYQTSYAGDTPQRVDLTGNTVSLAGLLPGITYYWQVRAKSSSGVILGYSTVESFVTYGVLTEPVPIFPLNGSESYTNEPYLYWTSYSYSTFIKYKVRYSTDPTLTAGVLSVSPLETSLSYDLFAQLLDLDNDETYYWQVAATNNDGGTYAWSGLFSFTTPEAAGSGSMLPPTPTYPTGGVTVYSSSVTFYWMPTDFNGSLQYQVRYAEDISTDGSGMLNHASAINLPMTSGYFKQVAGLDGDQTYYWQVRTYNGSSFSAWSAVDNFTTDDAVLNVQTPVLLTPNDGELVASLQPTLYWYVNGNPAGYTFTIVYNTDGTQNGSGNLTGTSNVLGGANTTSGFFAQFVSPLVNGNTYYWQVIATKGTIDRFSEVRNFIVNAAAANTSNPIPIPTSPVDGVIVNTDSPVLHWVINESYSDLEFQALYSVDPTQTDGVLTNATATAWTTNLAATLTGLTPGAVYYWQVKSRTASTHSNESGYSPIEVFVVSAGAEPVMSILGSPVDGVQLSTNNPVLSWVNAAQSLSTLTYEVEVAENPEMNAAQVIDNVTGTKYQLTNLPAGKTYYWRVRSKTNEGEYSYYSGKGEFSVNSATDVESKNELPTNFELAQNYPNPFNPSTTIKFSIVEPSFVSLKIYDILGREVSVLINENLGAGSYNIVWNAENTFGKGIASGTYIYRLVAGDNVFTKKMMFLK